MTFFSTGRRCSRACILARQVWLSSHVITLVLMLNRKVIFDSCFFWVPLRTFVCWFMAKYAFSPALISSSHLFPFSPSPSSPFLPSLSHPSPCLDAPDVLSFSSSCKTLLQFMLTTLPVCGEEYLPVFCCVHGMCAGEGFLVPEDKSFLLEQLNLSQSLIEGGTQDVLEQRETKGTTFVNLALFLNNLNIFCVC